MAAFLTFAMASAALLFVVLSATVNALFLSSLGRTAIEVTLLAALSIAADVAKAGLPVVVVRAALARAWGHLTAATLMLALVIALSLASGVGFAALTRSTATSARETKAEQVAVLRRDIVETDRQLQRLPEARPASVIDAILDGLRIDRRWAATKSCTEITATQGRLVCTDFLNLKSERAQAVEHDRLETLRHALRDKLATLGDGASSEADPHSVAIGTLLGVAGTVASTVATAAAPVAPNPFPSTDPACRGKAGSRLAPALAPA